MQPTYTPRAGDTPTPQGSPGTWWNQGYKVASSMIADGPLSGIAVLDFGKPDILYQFPMPPEYRTSLIGDWSPPIYLTLGSIEDIAGDFATGFYTEASTISIGSQPQIVVALGTSNYWSPGHPFSSFEFYQHGVQWGNMVTYLNQKYDSYKA
jgi:hypothetical protein